jgi:DNA polymerase-1
MSFNLDDCKRFIEGFYDAYPGVKRYNEQYGGVTVNRSRISLTDFGRPRYISGYDDPEYWKVKGAERQANNHRVQGTAGDIMKITMARIYWSDYLRSLGVKTLLTIHDELVLSIPKKNFAKSIKCIVDAYTTYNFPVPIRTSLDAGANFGSLVGLTETEDSSIAWDDVPKWCEKTTMIPYTEEDVKANEKNYVMGDEEWLNVKVQ